MISTRYDIVEISAPHPCKAKETDHPQVDHLIGALPDSLDSIHADDAIHWNRALPHGMQNGTEVDLATASTQVQILRGSIPDDTMLSHTPATDFCSVMFRNQTTTTIFFLFFMEPLWLLWRWNHQMTTS